MSPPASIGRLTTNEAAAKLGVSRRRVLALVAAGRLPAERVGNQFLILPADLAMVKDRKPGRPPAEAKPAKKRKAGAEQPAVPGGEERQDAARRSTLKLAGIPLDKPKRKRK